MPSKLLSKLAIFYVKNAPNTLQFHTFHISLAITLRERNYAIKHCHKSGQLIRSFRQSVEQPTVCAASYWRAGLAWLQREWRWTHRWNDKQNCASAPVVAWPTRKSQSCMLSAFPQLSLPTWRWGNSTHRGKWPQHSFIPSTQSFFAISYRQLSMPKDLTLSKKNKCLSTSFTRSAH